ncbi:MAG: hypothetical protein PSX71_14340 [bacterium]|nr:hypothetical protein [bacterium]
MLLTARFILLLPFTFLLASCGSDNPPAEQLQSITVKDANGTTTALTVLDYRQGSLVRVRGYDQPGEDGIVGTTDDPLFNDTYADCRISTNNLLKNTSNPRVLHDPYAEVHGSSPISVFFRPFSDCALPGIKADSIANTSYINSGPDGKWFTADDVKGIEFTLSRTVTGSDLTYLTTPADTSTNVNATGLDHIVYNPYAGLDIHVPYTVSTYYGYDASGRVTGLSQTGHQTWYERQRDGFIKTREINPSSSLYGPARLREEYEKTSSGKIRVRSFYLLNRDQYDFFSSIGSSPTGQVLLGVLGLNIVTGEQLLALDGNTYYTTTGLPHYEIDKTGDRIDRIRQMTGPGIDTVWNTDDDVPGASAVFSYGITP